MSYTEQLRANNEALTAMNQMLVKLDRTLKGYSRTQKKATKAAKEQLDVEENLDISFERRTTALKKATKQLNKQGKAFEILSVSAFKAYTSANDGANAFEFFDLALTSTNEQVKILGMEAANARKIMYGFLPPGMFRFVNQLSTGFRFFGNILRKVKESGEGTNNVFTSMGKVFKKLPSFKSLSKLGKDRGRYQQNLEGLRAAEEKQKILGKDFSKEIEGRKRFAEENKPTFIKRKEQFGKILQAPNKIKERLELLYLKGQILGSYARTKVYASLGRGTFLKDIKTVGLKSLSSMAKNIKKVTMPVVRVIAMSMLYLLGIVAAVMLIRKAIWPALKAAFETAKEFSGLFLSGLASIWEGISTIFKGILEGDMLMILMGLWEIVWGILKVALGAVIILATGLFKFAVTFVGNVVKGLGSFIRSAFFNGLQGLKDNAGKILTGLLLLVAFFFGLPALLPVLIGTAIIGGIYLMYKLVRSIFTGRATGGIVSGNEGMTLVGERGPELVSLPTGSRVHTNAESKRMVGGNTFNITINAKDTSDAEMRRIAEKIGRMVNNKISRNSAFSNTR